jgi:hypothetical protein
MGPAAAEIESFTKVTGAERVAVGVLQDAVALVVHVLPAGRYPQIGKRGFENIDSMLPIK